MKKGILALSLMFAPITGMADELVTQLEEIVVMRQQLLDQGKEISARLGQSGTELLSLKIDLLNAKADLAGEKGDKAEVINCLQQVVKCEEQSLEHFNRMVRAGAAGSHDLIQKRLAVAQAKVRLLRAKKEVAAKSAK